MLEDIPKYNHKEEEVERDRDRKQFERNYFEIFYFKDLEYYKETCKKTFEINDMTSVGDKKGFWNQFKFWGKSSKKNTDLDDSSVKSTSSSQSSRNAGTNPTKNQDVGAQIEGLFKKELASGQ